MIGVITVKALAIAEGFMLLVLPLIGVMLDYKVNGLLHSTILYVYLLVIGIILVMFSSLVAWKLLGKRMK